MFFLLLFLDIKDGDKDGPVADFGRNCRQRQGGAAKSAGGGTQVNKKKKKIQLGLNDSKTMKQLLNGSGEVMMSKLFDVNHFPRR